MLDHPEDAGAENEMRYKLIIDSSDDGSLVRLLFSTGVLQRSNTRVYVCSDFPGDAELQKVSILWIAVCQFTIDLHVAFDSCHYYISAVEIVHINLSTIILKLELFLSC